MNNLKILIKKIPKKIPNNLNLIIKYQSRLTELAKNHNGYISSESYFAYTYENDYSPIYNISNWKNHNSWINWLNSPDRKEIYNEYYNIIHKEKYYILSKTKNVDDDFFLL